MSDTCSLFPPFGDSWPSCLLPSQLDLGYQFPQLGNSPEFILLKPREQKGVQSIVSTGLLLQGVDALWPEDLSTVQLHGFERRRQADKMAMSAENMHDLVVHMT